MVLNLQDQAEDWELADLDFGLDFARRPNHLQELPCPQATDGKEGRSEDLAVLEPRGRGGDHLKGELAFLATCSPGWGHCYAPANHALSPRGLH